MLDVDTNQGDGENVMKTIAEAQEWSEQTPPGSPRAAAAQRARGGERKPTNWAKLKDLITQVQQEEESKLDKN